MKRIALEDPRYYFNRHLQWLEFNRRVLEEACDKNKPLLERVKFLSITASNLDEFVEVRVSSFLQRIEHGSRETGADGLTAEEELEKVSAAMHVFVRDQCKCWNEELLPALAKQSIRVLSLPRTGCQGSWDRENFIRPPHIANADAGNGGSAASVSAGNEQSVMRGLYPAEAPRWKWKAIFRSSYASASAAAAVAHSI
jgi:hypothetical protein